MSIGVKLHGALTNIGVGKLKQRGGKPSEDGTEGDTEEGDTEEGTEGDTEVVYVKPKKKVTETKVDLSSKIKPNLSKILFVAICLGVIGVIIYFVMKPTFDEVDDNKGDIDDTIEGILLLLIIPIIIVLGILLNYGVDPRVVIIIFSIMGFIGFRIGSVTIGAKGTESSHDRKLTVDTFINTIGSDIAPVIVLGLLLTVFIKSRILRIDDNVISRVVFTITLVYIVHILWVILTFTSPSSLTCSLSTCETDDTTCNNCNKQKWKYYGKEFDVKDATYFNYSDYLFDIFTWFPGKLQMYNKKECLTCPAGYTPSNYGCSNNITCRKCNIYEKSIPIKDLTNPDIFKTLSPDQKKKLQDDYGLNTTNELSETEPGYICIPKDKKNTIYTSTDIDHLSCNNYQSCMESNSVNNILEFSWSDINDKYLPGQNIIIKNPSNNIKLTIPDNIYSNDGCRPNPYYKDNNKYGNIICDDNLLDDNQTGDTCSIRIPIPSTYVNTDTTFERDGSSCDPNEDCESEYPCGDVNEIIGSWNNTPYTRKDVEGEQIMNRDINSSDDWVTMLNSVRTECMSSDGQCYLNDNYICLTDKGTSIPILDGDKLVIPELTKEGCNNPLMVDTCTINTINKTCNALTEDDGFLKDDDSGVCRSVYYDKTNHKWLPNPITNISKPTDIRCIPSNKITILDTLSLGGDGGITNTLKNVTVADWINGKDSNLGIPNMCSRVQRKPLLHAKLHDVKEEQKPCNV